MKKLALVFVAACSLSVFGLTGCGGGTEENTVIQGTVSEPELSEAEQAEMDASMEASMNEPGN
jgi:hypothetical protein